MLCPNYNHFNCLPSNTPPLPLLPLQDLPQPPLSTQTVTRHHGALSTSRTSTTTTITLRIPRSTRVHNSNTSSHRWTAVRRSVAPASRRVAAAVDPEELPPTPAANPPPASPPPPPTAATTTTTPSHPAPALAMQLVPSRRTRPSSKSRRSSALSCRSSCTAVVQAVLREVPLVLPVPRPTSPRALARSAARAAATTTAVRV